MQIHRQRDAGQPAHTFWVRALALACALLIGFASTAQAAHTHGELLPKNAPHVKAPASASQLPNEASCPLCIAMHSALPSAMATGVAEVPLLADVRIAAIDHIPAATWHFARFSRPPPARSL